MADNGTQYRSYDPIANLASRNQSIGARAPGLQLQGQLNGFNNPNVSDTIWMGPGFSQTPPRWDEQSQQYFTDPHETMAASRGAPDSFGPMTSSKAQLMYNSLDAQAMRLTSDYTTAQLGHDKWNNATRQSYYNKALQEAQTMTKMLGRPVTPWEIMQGVVGEYQSRADSGGGGTGGGPTSTYSEATQITNPMTAKRLLDETLRQVLGRAANEQESANFLKALNTYEQDNPTISQAYSSGGANARQKSSQKGGTDPTQFAKDYARSREDAAEVAASGTYLNAFMQSLENPMEL